MDVQIKIEEIRRELNSVIRELQEKLGTINKKPQLRTSKHPVRGQLNIYRHR